MTSFCQRRPPQYSHPPMWDYILRSLEVKYLVLAGCVTDQCVESAVREACDKHYYVTLVTGTAQLIAAAFMVVCFGRVLCMRALQKN